MNPLLSRYGWAIALLALALAITAGVVAYNVGLSHGLAQGAAGPGTTTPPPYAYEWHRPWGIWPVFPLLFFFFWAFVARASGGAGARAAIGSAATGDERARFDEWHRRAHDQMKGPDGPDDPRRRGRAADRRDRRRLSPPRRICRRRRDQRRERAAARAHAASGAGRARSRSAESGRPHCRAHAPARVRTCRSSCSRRASRNRIGCWVSSWARTTTSPSRSARANSSRASRPCCGGPRARPRRPNACSLATSRSTCRG